MKPRIKVKQYSFFGLTDWHYFHMSLWRQSWNSDTKNNAAAERILSELYTQSLNLYSKDQVLCSPSLRFINETEISEGVNRLS